MQHHLECETVDSLPEVAEESLVGSRSLQSMADVANESDEYTELSPVASERDEDAARKKELIESPAEDCDETLLCV